MLLQNLSVIEITKIISDYIVYILYYNHRTFYDRNEPYFQTVEVSLLTILFSSVSLISIERLACILLNVRYKRIITKSLMRGIILTTWIVGLATGFLFLLSNDPNAKVHYYLSFDFFIVFICIITYTTIWIVYLRSRKGVNPNDQTRDIKKELRFFRAPVLILTSFLLFNCIPDIVCSFDRDQGLYNIILILWGLGYLSDPCIYIFMNQKTRKEAKAIFKRIFRGCLTGRIESWNTSSVSTVHTESSSQRV